MCFAAFRVGRVSVLVAGQRNILLPSKNILNPFDINIPNSGAILHCYSCRHTGSLTSTYALRDKI